MLPAPLFERLLAGYGGVKYRVAAETRSRVVRRVSRHLGMAEDTAERRRVVRELHRNAERWCVSPSWNHGFDRYWRRYLPVETVGEEHLQEAVNRGKGVIFLSSHIGAWRALPWCLADRGFALDIAYPIQWPYNRTKGASALSFIRQAMKVLGSGGNVGIMGDGHQGKNHTFDFLGQKIPFATGFAQIAQRTSSPVLPLFLVRRQDGLLRLDMGPVIGADQFSGDRETVSVAMTARFVARMEEMVREYPCNAPAYLVGSRLMRGQKRGQRVEP
jgi:KDO2-lipid IV(A) lauroyltransferase